MSSFALLKLALPILIFISLVDSGYCQTTNYPAPVSESPPIKSFANENIEDLEAPISPAFTLLGVTPSSIDSPKTTAGLAASLLSGTERGPGNLAIAFTPFWLMSHPKLTFQDYYDQSTNKGFENVFNSIEHTFAISIGGAEANITNSSGTQSGTGVGLGLSFSLFQGNLAPDWKNQAEQIQSDSNAELANTKTVTNPDGSTSWQADDSKVKQDETNLWNMEKQRVGFTLSFASAFSIRIPDQDGKSLESDRFGAWLTPAYKCSGDTSKVGTIIDQFTFLGVARYIRDFRNHDDYFDEGGRIVLSPSKMPFSISGEYLYRETESAGSDSKYGILFQYKINKTVSFVASYGTAFKTDSSSAGGTDNLVLFGINLGLSNGSVGSGK